MLKIFNSESMNIIQSILTNAIETYYIIISLQNLLLNYINTYY